MLSFPEGSIRLVRFVLRIVLERRSSAAKDGERIRMAAKKHILVVDDDVVLSGNIARLMRARGFEAVTADDGRAALVQMGRAAPFDAVVLDIRLPGMDGLETMRRIKAEFDVPVIILTGHGDVDHGVQAIREGAFDFLIKPCPIEDLVERVRNACDLGQIRRKPVLWPRTTAGELLLYAFIRLHPEDVLSKAVEILTSDQVKMAAETLFVTDGEDRIKGLITRKALVAAARRHHPDREITWEKLAVNPEWLPLAPVGRLMETGVKWARPEQSLKELARTMIEKRFRSMPVVEDERMIGIVRLRDILRYLPSENGSEGET